MFEKFKRKKKLKRVQSKLGKYPSNDMLNNAIRFILEGDIDEGIDEILWAIRKADGEIYDYLKPKLKEKGLIYEDEL